MIFFLYLICRDWREWSDEKALRKWLMRASTRWQNKFVKEDRRVAGLAAVGMLSEQREDGGTHNILSIFFF